MARNISRLLTEGMEILSGINLVNDPEKLLQVEGSSTILATESLG